jgi:MFS family permease
MKATLIPLLKTRRFLPFFLTQFLGAFNDNVFRQALILVIATGAVTSLEINTQNNIALALFILPYFLFSALAGQVADKYDKARLLRHIKFAEVCIMVLAAVGLFFNAVWFLMAVLFLMGLQSTFFGPIKYSIMPQNLTGDELVAGNALVQSGTFLAILFGSIGGVVLKMDWAAAWLASVAVLTLAVLGWLAARFIPHSPPADHNLRIRWNIARETWRILQHAREVRAVWYAVLAISWFWFLGAAYTTQLKVYSDDYLHATDGLYALLLATFSIGIGLGSVLCEKASGRHVELGLVPMGTLGLSLCSLDLFFSHQGLPVGATSFGIAAFLGESAGLRVLADLLLIGVFGGFYIVPLFAFVQHRSDRRYLSRIIAANNILNSLLMVLSAVAGIVVIGILDYSIPAFFAMLAGANLLVAGTIFTLVPTFLLRLRIRLHAARAGRLEKSSLEAVPRTEPALLICHRSTPDDVLLLLSALARPVRLILPGAVVESRALLRALARSRWVRIANDADEARAWMDPALTAGELVCLDPRDWPGLADTIQPASAAVPVLEVQLREQPRGLRKHRVLDVDDLSRDFSTVAAVSNKEK